MSKPPKIDRRDLKNPDEFIQKGTAIMDVIQERRSWVLPVVGGVVLIMIGWYAFEWWSRQNTEKGWAAVYSASKQPEPQRWDELKKTYESQSKTRATLFAASEIADHHFDLAKTAVLADASKISDDAGTAVDWYSKAIDYKGLEKMEKQLLLMNRASAYELQKKYDESLKDLNTAAEMGGDLKALALLRTGQIWELKGDATKANELYAKVSTDFMSSEYSKMAKNSIRRLKSPALKEQKL